MTGAQMLNEADIPVVDLSDFWSGDQAKRAAVAREFGQALEEFGFVTICGHGVPDEVTGNMYRLAKAFFHAPYSDKCLYEFESDAKTRGYIPLGDEAVASTLDEKTAPDLCEALVFPNPGQPENRPDGPNAAYWPDRPEGLREAVMAYYDALDKLARDLNRIAALALDLPEDYFDPYFTDPGCTLRLVNYPDQNDEPLPGQLRYGAHHDYGGFTILRQDDAPGGLQVCDRDGNWRDMPNEPKSFVINVGDLLSRWTNGRWRSTLHRVINPPRELTGSTERLSMVFFTSANADAEISALPTCVDDEHPDIYPPVKAGEYVRAKIATSHKIEEDA